MSQEGQFPPDDEPPGVLDPTQDEDLPRRRRQDTRRLRRDLGIGAVLLVATLLVAKALAGNHGKPGKTRTPTPSPPSSTSQAASTAGLQRQPVCPPANDGQVSCTTYRSVPPAFIAAVRSLLPRATQTHAITYELRATDPEVVLGIWWRTFSAQSDTTTIKIVVSRGRVPNETARETVRGTRKISYVRVGQDRLVAYAIEVQVNAPATHAPALADVVHLAYDTRLVSRP